MLGMKRVLSFVLLSVLPALAIGTGDMKGVPNDGQKSEALHNSLEKSCPKEDRG